MEYTSVKDIALHFFNKSNIKIDNKNMPKTMAQVKMLINKGYKSEDIIKVIDYLIDVKNVKLYSFGYILKGIESILHEINQKEKVKTELEKLKEMEGKSTIRGETSGGNRRKIQRYNSTGFGKVDFSDLFEKPGETD